MSYFDILMIQQNYFSDLYPAKVFSAKSFFPCRYFYLYSFIIFIFKI